MPWSPTTTSEELQSAHAELFAELIGEQRDLFLGQLLGSGPGQGEHSPDDIGGQDY